MAATTVTRKPSTLKAFQLTTDVDMHQALAFVVALASNNYSGSVNALNNAGTITWQMMINNQASNANALANLGDYVIIENNANASICKAADYANLYQ